MTRVNFSPVVRKFFLRRVLFPRLTTCCEITTIFVVAFCFVFVYNSNAAFAQSYSNEKNVWKSTRSQIEPGATSASDLASRRANVLLKTTNRASTTRTKTRSKLSSSSLKTYRPDVEASSVISPSSFREKKSDMYGSPDYIRKSLNADEGEQDEFADKEKLFGELERRRHINLNEEREKTPGLASFELSETRSKETNLSDELESEEIPYPSDSQESSDFLDEEVGDVQNARKNSYISGLELDGSYESNDEETDAEDAETDDTITPISPSGDDVLQDVETLDEQIAETIDELNEENDAPEEELAPLESGVEISTESDDSSEMEIDAPTLDLDESAFEPQEETETETFDAPSEDESQEEAESELIDGDETLATSDESDALLEDENPKETESETDDESDDQASLQEAENVALSEETDSESSLTASESSESDEEESAVPQTRAVPQASAQAVRYSLPADSILSLDDDEFKYDVKPVDAPITKADENQPQKAKKNSRSLKVSFPQTFADEEDLDEGKLAGEEIDSSDSSAVKTFESLEKEAGKESVKTRKSTQKELKIGEKLPNDSSKNAKAVVEFSTEPPQDVQTKSDDRLLSKLRVLQRGRQRRLFNGRLLEAPAPPSVDDLAPEVANQKTEVPLLTKENANLPSLDGESRTVESYKPDLESENAEKFHEEMKKFSWTKGAFTITPYGFLNLSVSADTQRATPGEFVLYVQSPEVDESSDFSVDARTSRLGLDIAGPRIEELSADVNGKVEFDFQGTTNGSKNKGGLQLRRAYVELVDKQHERKFLAGQDWEIISPVAPQSLNYLPLGFVGDMQYRRAQVRFEQGWTCSSDLHILGQVAVCDNVIGDYVSTSGVNAATSGWPVLEARLSSAWFGDARGGLPITLGISGHIGEQNYKFSALAGVPSASTFEKKAIKTWSANFDLDAPITRTQKIQGEVFTGSNLSTFCGGINQGIDLVRRDGVRSTGGWLAWHSDCTEKLDVNFGYGIDKPDEKDLVGTSSPSNGYTTARTQNQVYFANCIYNWTPNFMTGLETSYWQTDYQRAYVASENPIFYDMESGKSTRIEFVTRLSF